MKFTYRIISNLYCIFKSLKHRNESVPLLPVCSLMIQSIQVCLIILEFLLLFRIIKVLYPIKLKYHITIILQRY